MFTYWLSLSHNNACLEYQLLWDLKNLLQLFIPISSVGQIKQIAASQINERYCQTHSILRLEHHGALYFQGENAYVTHLHLL